MASSTISSELRISLVEDATKNAPRVAAALEKVQKEAAALQTALSRSNLPDRLQADLSKLRVSAATVDAAATSWDDYARARGLAGKASVDWSKVDAAAVKQFAAATMAAEKAVLKEEAAHARARHQQQQEAIKAARDLAAAEQHVREEGAREAARTARELAAEEARIARETTRELQREERERTRVLEREERERHRAMEQQHEAVARNGVGHLVATGAAAAVSAHGVVRGAEVSLEKGAELQHTRMVMEQAGIDPAMRKAIEDQALQLSAKYGNVSQIAIMDLAKEARSVLKEQSEVAPTTAILAAAKSALDANDPTGGSSDGLGMLVKGAESIGAAQDPKRLAKLIDAYVKAIEVMGHTINPEQIYEFDKYLKIEGARVSDRFLMTTGLSLAQELGGSTAGKDIAQTAKDIVAGFQNKHVPLKEMVRVGLIDRRDVEWVGSKNGKLEAKGIKAGHKGVKDADLAASDLDLWVYQDLLPALEKTKNIGKDREKQLDWVAKTFTGTEAEVISKLITQRESFENHAKLYFKAKDTSADAELNHQLAAVGLDAFTKALGNLEANATSPAMGVAGKALFSIADGLNWLAIKAKDHPIAAVSGAGLAATGGLAASGYLAYKMLNGFGLGTSATALSGSAAALTEAAAALSAAAAKEGVAGAATAAEGAAAAGAGATAVGIGAVALPTLAATGLGAYMADRGFGTFDPKKFEDTPENRKATQNIGALPGDDDDDEAPAPKKLDGARAAGGPVAGGRTYLVGENGPEIFTAGSSGQITSHARLMDALRDPATLSTPDVQRVLASAGRSSMDAETARAVRSFGFDLTQAVDRVADSVDRMDARSAWGRPGDGGYGGDAGGAGATPSVAGGSGRGAGGSTGSAGDGRPDATGATPSAPTSPLAKAGISDRPVESGADAFTLLGPKTRGEGIRPIDPNAFAGTMNGAPGEGPGPDVGGPGFNTRGVRNMNPGNIGWGKWAKEHGATGGAGSDTGHLVAVFPNFATGYAAMRDLAAHKYASGMKSLDELIAGPHGWTPGNHAAAAHVAAAMGLGPHDDAHLDRPEMMEKFKRGLSSQELGPNGAKYALARAGDGTSGFKVAGAFGLGGFNVPSTGGGATPDVAGAPGTTQQLRAHALELAAKNLGLRAATDPAAIQSYMASGGKRYGVDPRYVPWCAAYVGATLEKAGLHASGSLLARSYKDWGQGVRSSDAQAGDVMMEGRDLHHVGFATGQKRMQNGQLQVEMLSGNYSHMVRKSWMPASNMTVRRATDREVEHPDPLGMRRDGASPGAAIAPKIDTQHLEHAASLLDRIHGRMTDIHRMSASAQHGTGGGVTRVGMLSARLRGGFASAGSSFG